MNLDRLSLFPDQRIDGDFTECVGLAISDIWGNYTGIPRNPDFSYAQYFHLSNKLPSTAGSDPYWAMLAAVVYGCMYMSDADFTALSKGELYVANPANYDATDYANALKDPPKAVRVLTSYDDIVQSIYSNRMGAALVMRWYDNFICTDNGRLTAPTGNFSTHCVAVYDADDRGLLIKPWLGKDFGDGGYAYVTRDQFKALQISAYSFDPNAWRWLALAQIAVMNPRCIPDVLPQMIANPRV